ncbi:CcoQ/FixQ family Cbb3-type cytochrome c oxidase assembly chaperone [Chryseobacterium chendengshani]|uniref:CcoQ/FixQ family Cbb3-type cytochrome c oxidase assembly chaperone n=1 Tax=Chryseobacterium sp. LJ668 TaxID=2864040 RepID=UPI001C68B23A|nr:CcoQ/FixQ family Cbb3-type cytochrome c oxidase assembly chaperone [Chryseobacterium sp. LJ668]MBW8523735.1 CcoQ/FixQ family Cbb3-type cytochrome c oxidase assembly chaperone [Chryseobacterium sp. LJ668]QYK16679.1 CcoQ/FixQ family Cbb3-type cytochrome c oxidase assembly chaperone [Chryseobacterium sp. LJ668]
MKINVLTPMFVEKETTGLYEVLSLISIMLILLAVVIYIFTRKYTRDEVRAPLEDDNTTDSAHQK